MGILKTCTPRKDVLSGDLKDAIFAADFGDVVSGHGAPDVYSDPTLFFQNTHPARDLTKIVTESPRVYRRLGYLSAPAAGVAIWSS